MIKQVFLPKYSMIVIPNLVMIIAQMVNIRKLIINSVLSVMTIV